MEGGQERSDEAPGLLEAFGPMQPYIKLIYGDASPSYPLWLINSIGEAAQAIVPAIRAPHQIQVVLGRASHQVSLQTKGHIVVTPNPDVIGMELGGIVFLNIDALERLCHQDRVASILEEFVHAWMNMADYGDLITVVVAELYHGVTVVNGQWSAVVPKPEENVG